MEKALEFKNVSIGYHKSRPVLREVNFSLDSRCFLGVIGPNGGGKSTLIKAILGLVPILSGELKIFGKAKLDLERIGYVPQHANISYNFPLTVERMVQLGLLPQIKFRSGKSEAVRNKVQEALAQMEIEHLAETPIEELSGGQRQRAFIARALVKSPRLLLLDEPVSGVDHLRSQEFYQLLSQLKEKTTIILASHDLGVVPSLVDEVICVNRKVVYHGHPQKIMDGDFLQEAYSCDVELLLHGETPHRVIKKHSHD